MVFSVQSKWQNRQEAGRLEAMRVNLENERSGLLEQVNREKLIVQQSKVRNVRNRKNVLSIQYTNKVSMK